MILVLVGYSGCCAEDRLDNSGEDIEAGRWDEAPAVLTA